MKEIKEKVKYLENRKNLESVVGELEGRIEQLIEGHEAYRRWHRRLRAKWDLKLG